MANTLPQAAGWLSTVWMAGIVPAAVAEPFNGALDGPIASRNLSPLFANLGVPALRGGAGLDDGAVALAARLHWASHSVRERDGDQRLEFDGETQRVDLTLRVGLGAGFTVEASVPWVRHSGGSLDGLIDGWHGFWGLPDGARDDQPRDRLLFGYRGADGFLLDDTASGFGDAEFSVARILASGSDWGLSAFAHLKLDTGSLRDFTGSEETAYGGGLRLSAQRCLVEVLTCHLQAGLMDFGDSRLARATDTRVPFAGVSLALRLSGSLVLLGQLDAHANPYTAPALDDPAVALWGTLGVRWLPTRRWRLEGAFSEDLAVDSAPDITFILSVSRDF